MINKNYLALIAAFGLFICSASAQVENTTPSFSTYHKNIYGEFFGSSVLTGINYDMRLNRGQMDGIGFRVGVGGVSLKGSNNGGNYKLGVVTFPIEFNNLVGKEKHFFQSGVGLLPAYATYSGKGEITDNQFVKAEGFGLAGGFLSMGYRFQPINNGVFFQANWNPLILKGEGFKAGWIGLGIGVGFK